jgi:hypothetical protein
MPDRVREIEGHPCVEDALVKRDQPIQVGGEERDVMQVVSSRA